jgi:hypothetical protein
VRLALTGQADAAEQYNSEFLPFTVGEEATHQMQQTLTNLIDLIGAYAEMMGRL